MESKDIFEEIKEILSRFSDHHEGHDFMDDILEMMEEKELEDSLETNLTLNNFLKFIGATTLIIISVKLLNK